jgi:hypothetical protein
MRAGDVIQAGVVFAGERLAFALPGFALVNVVLIGPWLGVAGLLRLALRRRAESARTAEL